MLTLARVTEARKECSDAAPKGHAGRGAPKRPVPAALPYHPSFCTGEQASLAGTLRAETTTAGDSHGAPGPLNLWERTCEMSQQLWVRVLVLIPQGGS